MSRPSLTNKNYVLGIDIGGTKIDVQLFEVQGAGLSEQPIWTLKQDTRKGIGAHIAQIADIIEIANKQTTQLGGSLAGIGVGSPGRFDATGVIKPGTNQNLGTTPEEFDRVHLKERYQSSLAAKSPELSSVPLYVCNDGNAMLAGMLEAIQKGKTQDLTDQNGNAITKHGLRRKHVALFGVGTGVGHAIATVQDNSEFGFVTDGHASKLRVKVDDIDLPLLKAAKGRLETVTGKEEVLMFDDNTVRAEDLFRGPVINALARVSNGQEISFVNPDHEAALRFAGKYMARTVALIKSGESQDVEPANGWTADDKREAAKSSMHLIGGGVGSSPLGKEIIKYAKDEMVTLNANDIQLVQVAGENVAARAAATLVPESVYHALRKVGF